MSDEVQAAKLLQAAKLHEVAEKHSPPNHDWFLDDKLASKHLQLWRQNETTDPDHTRPISLGRKFTAIDAYYQIKRATATFGPIGQGWGWDLEEETVQVAGGTGTIAFAKCKVTLWYRLPGNGGKIQRCGAVVGMNQLVSDKGRPDDEAFKKATTDAVTKGLSYLGFSADVFMGLYDDSKYVSSLRDQKNRQVEELKTRLPEVLVKAVDGLPKVRDLEELNAAWRVIHEDLKKLPAAQLDYMKARFAMRKRQLSPEEPPPPSEEMN